MAQKFIKTEAIVLKRFNYKEADRFVTLYTKDLGKVSALAKGIRRLNSRKRSHLEPFNHSKVNFVQGKAYLIITQTELIGAFANLKNNLQFTNWGYYMCEIFDQLVPQEEESPILFDFLKTALETLNQSLNPAILTAYNLKLLRLLGFYQNIYRTENQPTVTKLVQYTFQELSKKDFNLVELKKIQHVLTEQTEEILEKEIKTLISFKTSL